MDIYYYFELRTTNGRRSLGRSYKFLPFGIETSIPWGSSAKGFFGDISKLFDATRDPKSLILHSKLESPYSVVMQPAF